MRFFHLDTSDVDNAAGEKKPIQACSDTAEIFIQHLKSALTQYNNQIHWDQSPGSKKAYSALIFMMRRIEVRQATPDALRDLLQLHEKTMGGSLKRTLIENRVTAQDYDFVLGQAARSASIDWRKTDLQRMPS